MACAPPQLLREHAYVESAVMACAEFFEPTATVPAVCQGSVYIDVVARLTAGEYSRYLVGNRVVTTEDRSDVKEDRRVRASRGTTPLSSAVCCSKRETERR